MDGFVPVNIYDLRRTENRTVSANASVLKTIIYKQISTGIKQEGSKSITGRRRGNKDYESAALTIELRAPDGSKVLREEQAAPSFIVLAAVPDASIS